MPTTHCCRRRVLRVLLDAWINRTKQHDTQLHKQLTRYKYPLTVCTVHIYTHIFLIASPLH